MITTQFKKLTSKVYEEVEVKKPAYIGMCKNTISGVKFELAHFDTKEEAEEWYKANYKMGEYTCWITQA